MENIADYLKKFRTILFKGEESARIVKEEIEKGIGAHLEEKDLEVKSGVVFIKLSGALKSEIFLKKGTLLKNIHDRGLTSILDLR
jgi:hypothetical protein